jgi:plastocyanin
LFSLRWSSGAATAGTRSPSATSSAGAGLEIKMVAPMKFDKTELTIDANKPVTLTVNNTEDGVRHNFALYKSKADADADKDEIASSKICSGACKDTVELNLAPGKYFFHCDVHPVQMNGTLNAK